MTQVRMPIAQLNARRVASTAVRRELRGGQVTLEHALADPRAQPLRLDVLLDDLPFVGPYRVEAILAAAGIRTAGKRVRELTANQRALLVVAARRQPKVSAA